MEILLSAIFSILLFTVDESKCSQLRLGFLYPLSNSENDPTVLLPFASAFTVALDAINSSGLLPFNELVFVWNDTRCMETVALRAMTEQYMGSIHAYIGPGNTSFCSTAARLAAAWNTPIISYLCIQDIVSNKTLYPTFSRTRPPNSKSSKSIVALLKKFNWRVVAILYCNPTLCSESNWWAGTKSDDMKRSFSRNGIQVTYINLLPLEHEKNRTEKILHDIQKTARIVILSSSAHYVPPFLVAAMRKGMTNGDYVYIIHELSYDYLTDQDRTYWWAGMANTNKELAEKAFHSVLALVPRPYNVTKYAQFESRVIEKFKEYPFYNREEIQIVPHYSAYLYDAVYLYALAVNKTIAMGMDPKNGVTIFRNMRGTSYQSITGFEVHLDENGDAEFNMTLLDLQKNPKGQNEMLPVGQFVMNPNGTQTLELLPNMEITWSENGIKRAPSDTPVCGFYNERCQPIKPDETIDSSTFLIITLTICLILGGAVSFLLIKLYRRRKFELELANPTWQINYNDIVFHIPRLQNNRTRLSMTSVSCSSPVYLQSFIVGNYKGTDVFVKKTEKPDVEIKREGHLQLKQVYHLHHTNITRFIGACVEPPNFYILMEYCSRGSLQDIILDDDIQLNSMFINSLVTDTVEGMAFLHSSEIKVHGNLKSSNCLVDSRWVLKVTDFGLHLFRDSKCTKDIKSLFWTAPEALRSFHCSLETQEGDVYSFGIILQELETRNCPFYEYYLEAEEIIDRVKATDGRPFRPKVAPASQFDDLSMLMTSCWDEDPDERPCFRDIKRIMRALNGGKKDNIVDKIIYMLEDYSSHLEDLVKERTEHWIEEKKRAEELLLSMLPKSVADQLMAGKPVTAEHYEEVSIFFSDIVGFTALCSLSTPLQIVDFLNDLYTRFDSVITNYDVYKVETIGDAYLVVSGLPIRNGHEHAREIANMALDFLDAQQKFIIRHRPRDKLRLRIGIHSGAVCAGVVGLRMPRYCLFGDAVNMASRIESTGEASKIHLSLKAKKCLDRFQCDGFDITERGTVYLKGKGHVVTYWLHGRLLPGIRSQSSPRRGTRELEFDNLNHLM